MKTCKLCNETKPIDEFYKHKDMSDGRLNHCKVCRKEYEKKRRIEQGDYVRLRERNSYQKNPQGKLQSSKKYAAANPERLALIKKRWDESHPLQKRAVVCANNAVRDGHLERQPCVVCGSEPAHKHHEDYLKPLNVVWLCPKHHKQVHKQKEV